MKQTNKLLNSHHLFSKQESLQQKRVGMMWALPGIEELKERQVAGSQVGLHGLKLLSLLWPEIIVTV